MVINSSIELLQTSNVNDFQKEKLEMIEENSKKMEKLINELLFLNKNNISKDQEKNINISELIKIIIGNFEPVYEKK
jgi:signal transduction histidine kinase